MSKEPRISQDPRANVADASFAVRMLAHFHTDAARGMAIADVWTAVGKVIDSAWIEHQRLISVDVSAAEQRLRDIGWLPWRDLYDSSSDSRTAEQVNDEVTNTPATDVPYLQFDHVVDSRGRPCIAVPLDDPSYKTGRG